MKMNSIMSEDIHYIQDRFNFELLTGKSILVTGATGLIGMSLVTAMLEWNRYHNSAIKISVLVRSEDKFHNMYQDYSNDKINILVGDVLTIPLEDLGLNYIIHGASPTSSKDFINHPVEVVQTAVCGTMRLLELARMNRIEGFVYLSSMEVYGTPTSDEKILETYPSNLDSLQVRNSYPESKRMCENLCADYASEYGVSAKIIRLTQTFGPGVAYQDGRVFAEFARCVIEHRDIVLKTKGETKRCYLYVADAVTAIMTVMIDGESGQAYNAANEKTYCSIYEMAETVATLASPPINVRVEEQDIQKYGYAPVFKMNLSTKKLEKLGWKSEISLKEMYSRMIMTMKESQ